MAERVTAAIGGAVAVVITFHGSDLQGTPSPPFRDGSSGSWASVRSKIAARRAAGIVAVSEHLVESCLGRSTAAAFESFPAGSISSSFGRWTGPLAAANSTGKRIRSAFSLRRATTIRSSVPVSLMRQ